MAPQDKHTPLVTLPQKDLEDMLSRAAERGARRALADVGLDGENAREDIRELRSLLQALNLAKRTAWQTMVRIATTGLLLALMAGLAIKFKLFGGQ
jgi:ribulose 1,5-bisphosphate carboxylase large subunit-like protein